MLTAGAMAALRDTLTASVTPPPLPRTRTKTTSLATAILTPLAALDEIRAVADTVARGAGGPSRPDRESLVGDVGDALGQLGTQLKGGVRTQLADFRLKTLRKLPTLLEPRSARLASAAASALSRQLLDERAVGAAWRDALAAFRDGEDNELCDLRVAQLRELVERRGHDWQAQVRELGDPLTRRDGAAAEEIMARSPRTDASVVWVAFANADLPQDYLRVGPVQFFSHRLWPDGARKAVPSLEGTTVEPGTEVTDDLLFLFDGLPGEHFVLARVEVGGVEERMRVTDRAPPEVWAREFTRGVVEAATARRGASEWMLLAGFVLFYRDGEHVGVDFAAPGAYEEARTYVPPMREPTGEALAELEPELVGNLLTSDVDTMRALGEVRWSLAADAVARAEQRVALRIRILERGLPIVPRGDWSASARRLLRDHWCREQLTDALFAAGYWGVLELSWRRHPEHAHYESEIMHSQGDGHILGVMLPKVIEHGDALAELHVAGSRRRRALRAIARQTADGPATFRWLEQLGQRFDTLLHRTKRQRNAIVHGATTVPAVVESVDTFTARLSAYLVAHGVQSAAAREDPIVEFEAVRVRSLDNADRLRAGESPGEILFRRRLIADPAPSRWSSPLADAALKPVAPQGLAPTGLAGGRPNPVGRRTKGPTGQRRAQRRS